MEKRASASAIRSRAISFSKLKAARQRANGRPKSPLALCRRRINESERRLRLLANQLLDCVGRGWLLLEAADAADERVVGVADLAADDAERAGAGLTGRETRLDRGIDAAYERSEIRVDSVSGSRGDGRAADSHENGECCEKRSNLHGSVLLVDVLSLDG